jgi:putative FmdB family regulatory protein
MLSANIARRGGTVPTYQYACTDCGHELEAVQSFSDDALTTCPECGGTLRKLFGNVGVVFKGSGFYRNDSRSSSESSSSGATKSDSGTSAASTSASSTSGTSTSTTAGSSSTSSSTAS